MKDTSHGILLTFTSQRYGFCTHNVNLARTLKQVIDSCNEIAAKVGS